MYFWIRDEICIMNGHLDKVQCTYLERSALKNSQDYAHFIILPILRFIIRHKQSKKDIAHFVL